MKKLITIAAAVFVTATIAACSSASPVSALGTWGEPDTAGAPSLVFEADGNVHGSDGCNRLMGSYEEKNGEISFGMLASTMMFCDGVDDWLKGANTASITGSASGETMNIYDAEGELIGSLDRQSE